MRVLTRPNGGNGSGTKGNFVANGFDIGSSFVKGQRYNEMEDRIVVEKKFNEIVQGLVCVIDGHGGVDCSEFLSRSFPPVINRKFNNNDDWDNAEELLNEIFEELDQKYLDEASVSQDTSGACAIVLLMRENEVVIANTGDCRAVISTDVGPVQVSHDHRATDFAEQARITEAGGSVVNGRVANLAPSRTFGDIDVKNASGIGVIVPTPDFDRLFIQSEDSFLIVASDGLWDVVSNKDAIKVAGAALKKSKSPQEASKALIDLALAKKSTDDISVAVVVWN